MSDYCSPSGDACTGAAMSNGEGSPRSETVEPGGPDSPAAANPEIDLRAELRESHVEEVLDKLDSELVGLKAVKTRIREIAALLLVDRVRRRLELTTHTPTPPHVLHGQPGYREDDGGVCACRRFSTGSVTCAKDTWSP